MSHRLPWPAATAGLTAMLAVLALASPAPLALAATPSAAPWRSPLTALAPVPSLPAGPIPLNAVPATASRAQRAPAQASLPKHTLTITATDLSGQPDTGDHVIVINADDSDIFGLGPADPVHVFRHGVTTYRVPAGHYWAVGEFGQYGLMSASHVVVLPQFSVTANTTEHLAERSATSKITMVTPRAATAFGTNFWILRPGRHGPPVLVGWANNAGPMWVSPTRHAPSVGALHAYASQELASPAGPGVPYRYAVSYEDPGGVVSGQRYVVRPGDLATISERYYQAGRSRGLVAFFGALPDSFAGYVEPVPFRLSMPGRLTAYLGGNIPAMTWSSYADVVTSNGRHYESGQEALFQPYPAGEHVTQTWNAYPLHPAVNVNPDPRSFLTGLQPSATRTGNTLRLNVTPFGDNQPGHLGTGFLKIPGARVTGTYQIDQDGRRIAAGSALPPPDSGAGWFTTQVRLSPKPSVISFELAAARTGPAFPLSNASHTVWTWRSARETGAILPANWYCFIKGNEEVRRCAVQPMMSLRYLVRGMSLAGRVPAGREVVDLTVGHLPLVKAIPVARARVAVSFDGGRTWRAARVTGRDGHYQVAFQAPPGAYVTVRTAAWDTVGGSVTETITRAFRVAP